ncbi:MAG: glucosaminidase domain-containing protein [Thermoleophilia bacterium]|nr:glucosaminidase domain-containing protein [Thermoleophilia bacterium]
MVTPAQLDAELSYVNPGHIHPDIAQLYVTWGSRFGIKADLAFSQMLHETNYLRYTGDVRSWQNNFAGIGATGGGNPGNSFPSAEAGVIAHYAHLAWYVYPNHVNEYCNSAWDPRHFGTTHRNTVRTLRDLGGQWAVPGVGYGDALALYATRIWNRSDPFYISFPIIGGIRLKWDSLNWAPGRPLNVEYSVTSANGQVLGQAQDFENGRVIWNPAGGVSWIHGAILAKYNLLGREAGILGMPRSDEYGVADGRASDFSGGKIYWSSSTAAHTVYGGILGKYLEKGGPDAFGFPISDEQDVLGAAGARENQFTRGRIYWSGTTSSHEVRGAILSRYLSEGGPASLGLPITDEISAGNWGGRESRFENDCIYWSAFGGAHMIAGAIKTRYLDMEGAANLGVPTTDVFDIAGASGSQRCGFQLGALIWNQPLSEVYLVRGAILTKYDQLGGPAGSLGLPVSDESDVSGVNGARESEFTGGKVYWGPGVGAYGIVAGPIMAKYLEAPSGGGTGGPAYYGLPVSDVYNAWDGNALNMQKAIITWNSTLEAHAVSGGIMGKYQLLGGPTGALHLATGEEMDVPGIVPDVTGARMNTFQNGNVYWSSVTGGHTVNGGVYITYMAYCDPGTSNCGPNSRLGLPITDEYSIPLPGGGRRSQFQHGFVTWGALYGTWIDVM